MLVFRCHPRDSKSRRKLSSSSHGEKDATTTGSSSSSNSSDDDDDDDDDNDDMLYIPVESDDEVKVHSGSESPDSASPSSRRMSKTTDGEIHA